MNSIVVDERRLGRRPSRPTRVVVRKRESPAIYDRSSDRRSAAIAAGPDRRAETRGARSLRSIARRRPVPMFRPA